MEFGIRAEAFADQVFDGNSQRSNTECFLQNILHPRYGHQFGMYHCCWLDTGQTPSLMTLTGVVLKVPVSVHVYSDMTAILVFDESPQRTEVDMCSQIAKDETLLAPLVGRDRFVPNEVAQFAIAEKLSVESAAILNTIAISSELNSDLGDKTEEADIVKSHPASELPVLDVRDIIPKSDFPDILPSASIDTIELGFSPLSFSVKGPILPVKGYRQELDKEFGRKVFDGCRQRVKSCILGELHPIRHTEHDNSMQIALIGSAITFQVDFQEKWVCDGSQRGEITDASRLNQLQLTTLWTPACNWLDTDQSNQLPTFLQFTVVILNWRMHQWGLLAATIATLHELVEPFTAASTSISDKATSMTAVSTCSSMMTSYINYHASVNYIFGAQILALLLCEAIIIFSAAENEGSCYFYKDLMDTRTKIDIATLVLFSILPDLVKHEIWTHDVKNACWFPTLCFSLLYDCSSFVYTLGAVQILLQGAIGSKLAGVLIGVFLSKQCSRSNLFLTVPLYKVKAVHQSYFFTICFSGDLLASGSMDPNFVGLVSDPQSSPIIITTMISVLLLSNLEDKVLF